MTSNISQLLPLFDVDHLEIENFSNLTIVFYPLGNFGQALCIKACHEDLILTRKSHNCAGIAFIQGDSTGGSILIEQTLIRIVSCVSAKACVIVFPPGVGLQGLFAYDFLPRRHWF